MTTKTAIRNRLLETRLALSADQVVAKTSFINRQLQSVLQADEVSILHYYESLSRLHEIDVSPYINYLIKQVKDIQLYTSRKIAGVWETINLNGEVVDASIRYTSVIVPMIGFDTNLHRLGYGGGYYDRLLLKQPHARKVGVCFEFGKCMQLPHSIHDIPMDIIITERQLYLK